eukprot:6872536-Prymnesium_polylepis.1
MRAGGPRWSYESRAVRVTLTGPVLLSYSGPTVLVTSLKARTKIHRACHVTMLLRRYETYMGTWHGAHECVGSWAMHTTPALFMITMS